MSKALNLTIVVLVALIVVGLAGIAAILLLRTPSAPDPTPVPSLTATVEAGGDGTWERIKAAGKIVVGTSADYPPFEYYVHGTQLDGFDIALMDELGRRLGVEIEYRDVYGDLVEASAVWLIWTP